MSVAGNLVVAVPNRLTAVLAAGQRHLARTAVNTPTPWDKTRQWKSAAEKRLAREAWELERNPLEGVELEVTVEEWKDAPSGMHFERWFVVVDGLYTIVAEFEANYPFKPPHLKVRIEDGVLMDLKTYLAYATSNLDKSGPFPGFEEAYTHIHNDATMRQLALTNWSPALGMKKVLEMITADKLLTPVLAVSATWNENEKKARDTAAAAALEDERRA